MEAGPTIDARARLDLIFEWYRGMVVPATGRLAYLYDPVHDHLVATGEPIREIAAARDVARLARFCDRRDLRPTVDRTIRHWERRLFLHDGGLVVRVEDLGEVPGIAHSAFLVLAMLEEEAPRKEAEIRGLVEAILHQQREDGSLKVWFADLPDEGLEFYPGEALLALLEVHAHMGDERALHAAERGFDWFRGHLGPDDVLPDLLVFFANWQSQYGARLYRLSPARKAEVRDYLFSLHDRVIESGFYDAVAHKPQRQATVQVACALEGLVEAYAMAAAEGLRDRAERYRLAAGVARDFLFRAQRVGECTARERGGFGHSLAERGQRIDVTGHAANGLVRAIELGLAS